MLSKSFSFTVNNYGQLLLKAVMSQWCYYFIPVYTGMELILERKIMRDCGWYLEAVSLKMKADFMI